MHRMKKILLIFSLLSSSTWLLAQAQIPKAALTHEKARFEFNIFPNPTHGATSVSFQLQTAGTVTLTVLDIIGRELSKQAELYTKGQNKISFDLSGQTPGMYFVQLDGPDGKNSKRLVLR
jgi:hypothetical protein